MIVKSHPAGQRFGYSSGMDALGTKPSADDSFEHPPDRQKLVHINPNVAKAGGLQSQGV